MNRGRYGLRAALDSGGPASFEVVASNVGTVHRDADELAAHQFFDIYVSLSAAGDSSVGDESITLFRNGEIEREFVGALALIGDWREAGCTRTEMLRRARFGDWSDYPPTFKQRLVKLIEQGEQGHRRS